MSSSSSSNPTTAASSSSSSSSSASSSSFVRPSFALPLGRQPFPPQHAHTRTLYDVLAQSATSNPHHTYALQYDRSLQPSSARPVSHAQLKLAVDRCSAWLTHNSLAQRSIALPANNTTHRGKRIAVFLGSDLNILIHVVALLKLGNPVALFSARLSAAALHHLVHATDVDRILTTPLQWRTIADDGIDPALTARTVHVLPYTDYIAPPHPHPDSTNCLDALPVPPRGDEPDHNDMSVFAWHSSGSTGLPKPVFHTHRFWHCYLACHAFAEHERVHDKLALNMPPLYHGFGMLPMALAISVGFTVVLPPPATIPTAQLTIDMLDASRAHILFTVPSLLSDMLITASPGASPAIGPITSASVALAGASTPAPEYSPFTLRALDTLRRLEIVTFAGAPIKPATGDALTRAGVRLLNHVGATEVGSLSPIRFPPPGHEWRWLLLRDDMGLQFQPFPGTDPALGYLQLSSHPFGWQERFHLADAMVSRHVRAGNSAEGGGEQQQQQDPIEPRTEYTIAGRLDNILLLATGEKVSPILLEQALTDLPAVDDAVLFGSGRFQVGALVELSPAAYAHLQPPPPPPPSVEPGEEATADVSTDERTWTHITADVLATQLLPALARANARSDAHAQLEPALLVLTTRARKPFVRTAKDTTARGATLDAFADEIARAYEALEEGGGGGGAGEAQPAAAAAAAAAAEGSAAAGGASADDTDALARVLLESPASPALETALAHLVQRCLSKKQQQHTPASSSTAPIAPTDDFFEQLGMDSLKATRLLRILNAAVRRRQAGAAAGAATKAQALGPDFVYRHCSVAQLAAALRRHLHLRLPTTDIAAANGSTGPDAADETATAAVVDYGDGMDAESIAQRTRAVDALVSSVEREMESWRAGSADADADADADGEGGRRARASGGAVVGGAEEIEGHEEGGATVVLTGSTGGLGAWLVHALLTAPRIARVVCLVRPAPAPAGAGPRAEPRMSPLERQLDALASKGVPALSDEQRARLVVLPTADLSAPRLGLAPEDYASLLSVGRDGAGRRLLVLHNAWPVDFLRPLHSFAAQVRATARLLHFASEVRAQGGATNANAPTPTRFLFSSTIAVVGKSYALPAAAAGEEAPDVERGGARVVKEEALDDAARTVPMGYALAKLACERLVSRTHARWAAEEEAGGTSGGARASSPSPSPSPSPSASPSSSATSVRIGQLTGAEGVGNWSHTEHMALVLASSAHVGCLPRLDGSLSWLPTNRAARAYVELALHGWEQEEEEEAALPPVLHLENPARTDWAEVLAVFADELGRAARARNSAAGAGTRSLVPTPAISRRGSDVLLEDAAGLLLDGGGGGGGDGDDAGADARRKRQRGSSTQQQEEEPMDTDVLPAPEREDAHRLGLSAATPAQGSATAAAAALGPRLLSVLTPPETPGSAHSHPVSKETSPTTTTATTMSRAASLSTPRGVPALALSTPAPSSAPLTTPMPMPMPMPIVDFEHWLSAITTSALPDESLPARKLLAFLRGDFVPIATGQVVLGMEAARARSEVLRRADGGGAGGGSGGGGGEGAVREGHVREYVAYWRRMGLF